MQYECIDYSGLKSHQGGATDEKHVCGPTNLCDTVTQCMRPTGTVTVIPTNGDRIVTTDFVTSLHPAMCSLFTLSL